MFLDRIKRLQQTRRPARLGRFAPGAGLYPWTFNHYTFGYPEVDSNGHPIAPGASEFLITQNDDRLITQNGDYYITNPD